MAPTHPTVADYIAKTLWDHGVRSIFCVLGDGNLDWSFAFRERGGAVLHARHEGNAVAMADGAARATGEPAIATVTSGPGLTQTATALATAVKGGSPVVIVAGDVPREPVSARDRSQTLDQAAFTNAIGARFVELTDSSRVADTIGDALERTVESGPTVISCRTDFQRRPVGGELPRTAPRNTVSAPIRPPTEDDLKRVMQVVESSSTPFVLVGRGSIKSGADEHILRLASTIGAPIGTTMAVKGYLSSDDYHVDVVGGYGTRLLKRLADETDILIAVGTSLSPETMAQGRLFSGAQLVHIGIGPARRHSHFGETLHVEADAASFMRRLADAMDAAGFRRRVGRRTPALRAELGEHVISEIDGAPWPKDDSGVDPRRAIHMVGERLPPNEVIVSTVGHFGSLPPRYIRGRPDQRWVMPYDFGAIGLGLSTAIGAAKGSNRHVTLFEGDGSFLMNVQELDTLRRLNLPLTVLVMNDNALGAEFHQLAVDGKDPSMAIIDTPAIADVAAAFGIQGIEVSSLQDLADLDDRTLFGNEPLLVDIKLSTETRLRSLRWVRGYDRVEWPIARAQADS